MHPGSWQKSLHVPPSAYRMTSSSGRVTWGCLFLQQCIRDSSPEEKDQNQRGGDDADDADDENDGNEQDADDADDGGGGSSNKGD